MKSFLLRTLGFGLVLGAGFFLGRRTVPPSPEQNAGRTQVIAGENAAVIAPATASATGTEKILTARTTNWEPLTCSADELLKRLFEEPGMHETQYLLYRSIGEAPPQLLIDWAAALAAMPSSRTWQPEALRAVAKRWAELDASVALGWAQGLPPAQGKSAMTAVLAGIAAQDPARAITMARSLPSASAGTAALIAVADVLRKKDPAGAFALVSGLKSYDAQSVIHEALATWAASDPEAAAAAAVSMGTGDRGENSVRSVYNSWALQDPMAALASAGNLPKGRKRNTALSSALHSWAQRDPAAALAYCQSLPARDQGNNMGSVLEVMIKSDSQGALAAFQTLPAKARLSSISSMTSTWAETDMDAAAAWAKSLTNSSERATAMQGLASGAASLDPASRQALIDSMPEGKIRHDFLLSIVTGMANWDPTGAAKLVESMEPHARKKALSDSTLIHYLDGADPEVSFRLVAALPGQNHSYQLGNALSQIAISDPARAEMLALSLGPEQQKNALPSLYGGLARTDGPGTLAKVRGVADEATRKNSLESVFSNWAWTDADGLLAWSKSADPAERSQAQISAIQAKAGEDPGSAVKLIDAFLQTASKEEQASTGGMISAVSSSLFQENPQEAANWGARLPAGEFQNQVIGILANYWVESDPVEASVWIRSLPAGSSKDSAVGQLISGISESDPASALAWAGSIGEAGNRNSQMGNIFQTWIQNDKAAALEALKTAPMEESAKESIRQNAAQ